MLMRKIIFACHFFLISQYGWTASAAFSPDEALKELIEGNKRFAAGKSKHTHWEEEARLKKSGPQFPFAVIVGCSDSRVPPEIIFDQGLGDLFTVRDAGNVVGSIELASIEFGLSKFNIPLIVVLGHQECGAVQTVLKETEKNSGLEEIYGLISSAISQCKQKQNNNSDKLVNAIYCNVKGSMETLKSSPLIASYLKQKKLNIVGGYYDFNTGQVSIIPAPSPTGK
jgi:carbonic anhydrase